MNARGLAMRVQLQRAPCAPIEIPEGQQASVAGASNAGPEFC